MPEEPNLDGQSTQPRDMESVAIRRYRWRFRMLVDPADPNDMRDLLPLTYDRLGYLRARNENLNEND